MKEMLESSVFFGVGISLLGYEIGLFCRRKWNYAILNPLMISILFVIGILTIVGVDYETYYEGARYLTYLLTPTTVCLSISLYEKLQLLKENWKAVVLGILSGVITSALTIFLLALLFGLTHEQYVTLLPKSITTAIGIGMSEEMGGMPAVTVAAILVTGVFGAVSAELILKLLRITEPIAKGVAIGTASHALGTTKAMEMGETEGAMSGLAIAVAGLMTVAVASFASGWIV